MNRWVGGVGVDGWLPISDFGGQWLLSTSLRSSGLRAPA